MIAAQPRPGEARSAHTSPSSAANIAERIGRQALRLVPDACLRVNRQQYLIYSSRGVGASFRTDDLRLALWIFDFSKPKSVAQVLQGLMANAHQSVLELIAHLYELGVLIKDDTDAAHDPDIEHRATSNAMSALMESVYDLAGNLRGMGPTAHELLRNETGLSLQHRIESLLAAVGSLHADLAALRAPAIQKQLAALGVNEQSTDLQLHIGSGGFNLPGWINIDNYPAPLSLNLDNGLPFRSASARYVFLSHLLEHLFYPRQAHALLDEIKRVLQPGGVVRIVVPDIEQCIAAYVDNDQAFYAGRLEHWQWWPKDATRLESFLAYAGAGPNPQQLFENHKFGYDFETLQACLRRCGFVHVRRCGYQQSPIDALRVDHAGMNATAKYHDRNGERHYSLFIEAQAPGKG